MSFDIQISSLSKKKITKDIFKSSVFQKLKKKKIISKSNLNDFKNRIEKKFKKKKLVSLINNKRIILSKQIQIKILNLDYKKEKSLKFTKKNVQKSKKNKLKNFFSFELKLNKKIKRSKSIRLKNKKLFTKKNKNLEKNFFFKLKNKKTFQNKSQKREFLFYKLTKSKNLIPKNKKISEKEKMKRHFLKFNMFLKKKKGSENNSFFKIKKANIFKCGYLEEKRKSLLLNSKKYSQIY